MAIKLNRIKSVSLIGIFIIGILGFIFCETQFKDSFRTTEDKIDSSNINLTGLNKLNASGGNLPRFLGLMLKFPFYTKKPVIIVNGESDVMFYAKGLPISILGYRDKSTQFKHYLRRLLFAQSIDLDPSIIHSEEEESKKYGFDYVNIPINSRSSTPDENVDTFVNFIENRPSDKWLHFHCHHGQGRTTLMLCMMDILYNAPAVSLEDIVKRHYTLGGTDLFDTEVWSTKLNSYTKEQLENRKKFIENFYTFVVQRKNEGIQKWSDWNNNKSKINTTL